MQEQTSNSIEQFISGRPTPREREAIIRHAVRYATEQVSRRIVRDTQPCFLVKGRDPRGRAM